MLPLLSSGRPPSVSVRQRAAPSGLLHPLCPTSPSSPTSAAFQILMLSLRCVILERRTAPPRPKRWRNCKNTLVPPSPLMVPILACLKPGFVVLDLLISTLQAADCLVARLIYILEPLLTTLDGCGNWHIHSRDLSLQYRGSALRHTCPRSSEPGYRVCMTATSW